MQKGVGQTSRSERSKQILPQSGCFRTVTPVWIHRWLRNNTQRLTRHRRCVLLFFDVICQITRSQGPINRWFGSNVCISVSQLQFGSMGGYEITHVAFMSIEVAIYCFSKSSVKFQGHPGWKNWIGSHLKVQERSQLSNPSDVYCFLLNVIFLYETAPLQWIFNTVGTDGLVF